MIAQTKFIVPVSVMLIAIGIWTKLWPTSHPLLDLLLLVLSCLVWATIPSSILRFFSYLRGRSSERKPVKIRSGVALLTALAFSASITWWASLSIIDSLATTRRVFSDKQDDSPLRSHPTHLGSQYAGPRVGIALSGGGYRAALFHAGVIQELEEFQIHSNVMSTVSGGSIFGAFMHAVAAHKSFCRP
jgi:hypothetical protein